MWRTRTIDNTTESSRKNNRGRNALGAIALGLIISQLPFTSYTDLTKEADSTFAPSPEAVNIPQPARMGNFIVKIYNVYDTLLKTDNGMQVTLEYIQTLLSGKDVVLALQEVRNISKAKWLQQELGACLDRDTCEWGMYPEGDGSSVPWIWNNDRFEIVQNESFSQKLHNKRTPHNENGDTMIIKQKWVTLVVLKDVKSKVKIALVDIHLARDYQTKDGMINSKAPELLKIYNDEMDTIESILKTYLDMGYSVILAGDTNWNHNQKTVTGSPPERLKKIGFTNMYHDNTVIDKTPHLQSTHHDVITDDDTGNIDAIYIANPVKSAWPYTLTIKWRENYGPDAPSDHNAIGAGIIATPLDK